ncbi:MAG: START-like domain-containing protein [Bacteroidota bacterium]
MSKNKKIKKKKSEKEKSAPEKSTRTKAKQKATPQALVKDATIVLPSKPEPKNKLVLEYIVYASPHLLYEFISSPSGLSEWFSDDVNINGNVYTFIWDGAKQQADAINISEGKSIRFRWTDRPLDTYFEFKIEKNELTHELSLIITDFAESAEEKNSLEMLWDGQVQRLMKVIGSKV